MLDAQGEGVGDVLDQLVDVVFLHLEGYLLLVEHRHLEHLLNEETQALALVADDAAEMVHHALALGDAGVGKHLRSKRDARDWRFQLVGHIVDEVVTHLRETLLAEYDDDGEGNLVYRRFSGWKKEGATNNPTADDYVQGNTVFIAQYPTTTDRYYTVRWFAEENETAIQDITAKYGTDISLRV